MLSATTAEAEAARFDIYAGMAAIAGHPLVLTETSSACRGGIPAVSDSFASALWVIDYLLTGAEHGVHAMNIATGLSAACTTYTVLCLHGNNEYFAQPVYYGLLLTRMLGTGRLVPVSIVQARHQHVTAFALRSGGRLRLMVENLDSAAAAVTLHVGSYRGTATADRLRAPSLLATSGVTIQGRRVSADGSFSPGRPDIVTCAAAGCPAHPARLLGGPGQGPRRLAQPGPAASPVVDAMFDNGWVRLRGKLLRPFRYPVRWLAFLAGGVPAVLVFPGPSLSYLAWFALVPAMALFTRAGTTREAIARGWWFGAGYLIAILQWMTPEIGPGVVLIGGIFGCMWSPFAVAVRRLLRPAVTWPRLLAALAVVPATWLIPEWIRSYQGLGGPWGLYGASQWQHPAVLALAGVGGVWLVSVALLLANTGLTLILGGFRPDLLAPGTETDGAGPGWPPCRARRRRRRHLRRRGRLRAGRLRPDAAVPRGPPGLRRPGAAGRRARPGQAGRLVGVAHQAVHRGQGAGEGPPRADRLG